KRLSKLQILKRCSRSLKMFIKMCGFQDGETAGFAAQAGADLIGMILTAGFKRSVTLEQAKKIVEAARKKGAAPAGGFVSEASEKIASVCQLLGIETVQAYNLSGALPAHLKRIYINEPHAKLRPQADFLLMETEKPGTGAKLDFDKFTPPQVQPWLIAGG